MKQTVTRFVETINAHDVEGIVRMMSNEYVFVNSSGDRFTGHDFMRETWAKQFQDHPDFRIHVEKIIADEQGVAVFGMSEGTYAPDGDRKPERRWTVPAAFLGLAAEGKMTYWESFSDTSIVYDLIRETQSADEAIDRAEGE
ncbi:MAG: nuclear transport factor 2 family protein [Tepidisphaeraceae bacterium]